MMTSTAPHRPEPVAGSGTRQVPVVVSGMPTMPSAATVSSPSSHHNIPAYAAVPSVHSQRASPPLQAIGRHSSASATPQAASDHFRLPARMLSSQARPNDGTGPKLVIMDPPSHSKATQSPGSLSPNVDYGKVNPKYVDDTMRLTFAIQQGLPESVRRVVRDNWQKCLMGSEFHQAFVVSRVSILP